MSAPPSSPNPPTDEPDPAGFRAPIGLREGRIEAGGEPALLLSGEVHYFRLSRVEWADRLRRAKDTGLDTVASYIPWLWHEVDGPLGPRVDLTGETLPERDLAAFVDLCDSFGLRFIARPGPFVMAELKNEGLPHRLYRDLPSARPVGWDGRVAETADLDYLEPGYLDAARQWLDAVYRILAPRQAPNGPVVGVQLDNEVGMLAWVSNTPHLNDHGVAGLTDWLIKQNGLETTTRMLGLSEGGLGHADGADDLDPRVAAAVRGGGDPEHSLAFHHQLGLWARERFAEYLRLLEEFARDRDITVPLMINVHGTSGGRGTTFPIGVSQLAAGYRGRTGMVAGSDYYLGELTVQNVADLYLCNAILACVNGPDQPGASLEFEVGTGDYGDNLDALSSPESGVNKTLLTLGQGNRLINYYLLTGGRNPALDGPEADGIPRIAFTGERHGFAAPIDPEGRPTPALAAVTKMISEIRDFEPVLSTGRQLTDDLGFGFVADHYLIEFAHPAAAVRREQIADLERHRGFGARDGLGRALVLGGYHADAVDLQALASPDSSWAAGSATLQPPRTIVLATGRTLAADVQRRLVDHVRTGGRLLLTGLLPECDHDGTPCSTLADAFTLASAGVRVDRRGPSGPYWPTITGTDGFRLGADLRVATAQLLDVPPDTEVLLREVGSGLPCAVQSDLGGGSMIFLGCDLPAAHLDAWHDLYHRLGVERRVRAEAERPGLVTVPVASSNGNLLIAINLAPYPVTASIAVDGRVVAEATSFPARGHALLPW